MPINYRGVLIHKPIEAVERWRIDTTRCQLFFPSLASAKRYVKRKSWVLPEGRAWPFVQVRQGKVG